MKKKKKLLMFLLFAQITFAQTSWVKIQTQFEPVGTYHFYDGEFFDENNGWGLDVQNGKILNSIDGGLNWKVKFEIPKYSYGNIFKLNENIGWINYEKSDSSSVLMKTSDGGKTWDERNLTFYSWKVHFVEENIGYSLGDTNSFYKTIDGGENWDKMEIVLPDTSLIGVNLFFLNKNIGWVLANNGEDNWTGTPQSYLLRTSDGGINWSIEKFQKEIPAFGYQNILFFDSFSGIITNANGNAYYSTNGGDSWTKSQGITMPNTDLVFTNNNTGWLVGEGIALTIDTGKTWQIVESNTNSILFSVSFINSTLGYIFGTDGTLLKYDKTVGITNYPSKKANENELFLDSYPNPVNSLTNISVTLPESSFTQLNLYNVNGELVKVLYTGFLSQGKHSFKLGFDVLSSGFYICNLQQNNSSKSIKILLLK